MENSTPGTATIRPTLGDVVLALPAAKLGDTRRRDCLSAISRFCALAGRQPGTVLANPASIRSLINNINPVAHGISAKTWTNIHSNVFAAMRATGHASISNRGYPLAPVFQELYDQLHVDRLRHSLIGLFRYASARGIEPEEIDDATVEAFMIYHRETTSNRRPKELHRRLCKAWNEAAATVTGWPAVSLSLPSFGKAPHHLPWEQLPEGLRRDIDNYLNWIAGKDLFSDNQPPHVCRPQTVIGRRSLLRCAASAALLEGIKPEQLGLLRDITRPTVIKAIMTHYHTRSGRRVTQHMIDLAELLISVAKQWVRLGEDDVEPLRKMLRELVKRGPKQHGLTEKNRQMLRQFDDRQALARLLHLPETLLAKADRLTNPDSVRGAVAVQLALAVGILLFAPMRIGNLAGLRIDQHIARPNGKGGEVHLIIPGDQTKNEQPLHYPLPAVMTPLFDRYLSRARPILTSSEVPWLFPGEDDKHKATRTLSQQIGEVLEKHVGVIMTPHQFRHLAAKLLLDRHPGAYELARRLLGHKDVKTTTRFYAEFDMRRAAQYFDETILKLRRDNPIGLQSGAPR
jgi:integrase